MKCKRCGCVLSPKEKDDVLEALAEGVSSMVLCDDCWEEESSMEEAHDDVSDADSGL